MPASPPRPAPAAALAVYVHWPFCRALCPYCDFNVHIRRRVDQGRWCRALEREIDYQAEALPGRRVTSIHFGGGTPSLMAAETVAAVIARIAARWPLDGGAEIGLEANPSSADRGRFAGFRAAGVTRLSLGVQALDDDALGVLGRDHDQAQALAAVAAAAAIFPRLSIDLIYGRPGQTVAGWRRELRRAVGLGLDHLSAYQLTIEPRTGFAAAQRKGRLALPPAARSGAFYEATQDVLEAAGLPAYEISNHARPGAESRHNLAYWRYDDYLGLGPGAHGRITRGEEKIATRAIRKPEAWLAAVESHGHGTEQATPLDRAARGREVLIMGLRTTAGVDRARFRHEAGAELEAFLGAGRLAPLLAAGFLACDAGGLRASAAGRQRLDALLARLLA